MHNKINAYTLVPKHNTNIQTPKQITTIQNECCLFETFDLFQLMNTFFSNSYVHRQPSAPAEKNEKMHEEKLVHIQTKELVTQMHP